MRKILSVLFALTFLFLFGCAGKDGDSQKPSGGNTDTQVEVDYNQGVEMQKIKPLPYDKLAEQKSAEITVEETDRCAADGVTAIEFSGADYKGESTKVFAYVGIPETSADEKVPAVVLVHGGGGRAFAHWVKAWNERGFAAIAIDTEGKRPDNSRDGLGGPYIDYMFTDTLPIEEQWMFHAVSAAVRATSVISSYEQVDSKKIGIVGVSWGSVITSITLGVDDRLAFGAPIYGTGHLDESLARFGSMGVSENGWALWNPSGYFPFYTAKMHLFNSDHDPHFSANINSKSAYELGASLTYIAEHTHSEDSAQAIREVYAFADQAVNGKDILPQIKKAKLEGETLKTEFTVPKDSLLTGIEVYALKQNLAYYADTEYSMAIEKDFELIETPVRFDPVNGRAEITVPWQSKIMYFNIVTQQNGQNLRTSSRLFVLDETAIELPNNQKISAAPIKDWKDADEWNDDMMEAYLQPYWYTREIYNETVTFVGEEGVATLMYTPEEIRSVRSYRLTETYAEGKDYVIEGNKIRRLKGSAMPYWEPEEYFLSAPNDPNIVVKADSSKIDVNLTGDRYLLYGEYETFTDKQVAITYRHDEAFNGKVPEGQQEKLTSFLEKVESGEELKVMIYGDSVATGCNASGTQFGGMIAPYMPDAYQIVSQYITKNYGNAITMDNQAVGGWQISQCWNAYGERISGKTIDLMILRIGGNDNRTDEATYKEYLEKIINKFFAENPNANLIIQTPELPNQQTGVQLGDFTWTGNIGVIDDWTKAVVRDHAKGDRIAVADVQAFTNWVESRGKLTRDWLANNVNHANDFMIRSYAQILLKTMFADAYVTETYQK